MKHTIALAALVASTMGLATALPAAAQYMAPTPPTQYNTQRNVTKPAPAPKAQAPAPKARTPSQATTQAQPRHLPMRGRGSIPGDNILALVCSERGTEALDVSFVRLSHRLTLTAEQQRLFDALKSRATSAQASFAQQCTTLAPEAETVPDMVTRLKGRIAIDKARLAGLESILPDFEAFYGSLTEAQRQAMAPSAAELSKRAAGPQRMAPGREAPGRMAPGGMAPGGMAPGGKAPGGKAPGGMTPGG